MEIERIFIELCLYNSLDEVDILINLCRIHKYIASNYKYDEEYNDLDSLLYKGIGNSYSCSLLFKELVDRLDIENYIGECNDNHYNNLVKINNTYYIFDSGLELYYYHKKNEKILYAGMGINSYNKLYSINNIPENILKDSLDISLINYYKS